MMHELTEKICLRAKQVGYMERRGSSPGEIVTFSMPEILKDSIDKIIVEWLGERARELTGVPFEELTIDRGYEVLGVPKKLTLEEELTEFFTPSHYAAGLKDVEIENLARNTLSFLKEKGVLNEQSN